jgi:drug/metabolite transporter (DMT)-like permease
MNRVTRRRSGDRPDARAWAGLVVGVLGISGASVYMRLAGTDPLVTAFWRLALAALLLAPLQVWRACNILPGKGTPRAFLFKTRGGCVSKRSILDARVMLAGAFLALHFALWVTSLTMTSVLSSLVFVTMNPLFVAILDLVLLRGRTSPLLWVAVAIATGGGLVIGIQSGTTANVGNLLALGGSLAVSLYLIVGRRVTRQMDPVAYNVGVFGWAAVLTGAVCVVTGRPLLPLSGTAFLWLAVTAILSQTLGHGLINASLKVFQPQFVALMILWEPILGGVLAYLVLGEKPQAVELVGGAVILAGIALAIVAEGRAGKMSGAATAGRTG